MSKTPTKVDPFDITVEPEDQGDDMWIMSYADMVTLMFGFFVILYSFSTLDEKKFDQMSEKMSEAFKVRSDQLSSESNSGISSEERQIRALQMLVSMMNLGENVEDAVEKIEKSYGQDKASEATQKLITEKLTSQEKKLLSKTSKSANSEFQTVELILPAATLFPPGGFQLSKQATARLHGLADDLRQAQQIGEIEILGHTDGQPPSKSAFYDNNFTLSSLRAGAVASVLIRFGVDPKLISVRGMGSLNPLVPERNPNGSLLPDNMAKNRRVEILLKMRRTHAQTAH